MLKAFWLLLKRTDPVCNKEEWKNFRVRIKSNSLKITLILCGVKMTDKVDKKLKFRCLSKEKLVLEKPSS